MSWLARVAWTPQLVAEWQKFFNDAPRLVAGGVAGNMTYVSLPGPPPYEDRIPQPCARNIPSSAIAFKLYSSILIFISCLITMW